MTYLEQAIKDKFVYIDEKQDLLIYQPQGKERRLSNPEERVQLQTYLNLIYEYSYPPEHLRVCEKIQIGSSTREGDILIYLDDRGLDPWIIVECKKEGVSDSIFEMAIDQGFSYAAATDAQFVWATSGDRDAVFQVIPSKINEREKNRLDRIPTYKQIKKPGSAITRRLGRWFRAPVTSDTILFSVVLLAAMFAASWLAVTFDVELRTLTGLFWQQHGMDYSWVFNGLVAISTVFSIGIGFAFMRSHQLFGNSIARKRLIYFLICLILFLPTLFIAHSMSNPNWWSRPFFNSRDYPILVYLWPYSKSFPLQFFALYSLIWLSSRRTKE